MKRPTSIPFPLPAGQWFTFQKAGEVLGLSESYIEKLYDLGSLTGHSHNAGRGQRMHRRILRLSLVAYAISTADYGDESLGDEILLALPHLPKSTLQRVIGEARRLAS